MRHPFPALFAALLIFGICVPAIADQQNPAPPQSTNLTVPPLPLLPPSFDGWVEAGKMVESRNPSAADPGNAAALKEFGFQRYAEQHYSRGSETLTVKAVQFPDATGAYGAFTFYSRENMETEEIGSGGAFDGSRVLFWNGAVLVDAQFSHVNAMTASEMRDLVKLLPPANGRTAIPPPLPRYLPPTGLQKFSVRYALGASSYQLSEGVLPPQMAGFDHGAESVTAQYSTRQGDGTLTIFEYPTPQIAMEQEKAFNDVISGLKSAQADAKNKQFLTALLIASTPAALQVRRSGPLVAITSGYFSEHEAQLLLGSIHYDADITWNSTVGYIPETTKAARLLINIVLGSFLICCICLALGIALGGGRALVRVLRGKPASALDEISDFIKLNLKD
jgi:hypothetical protein